LIEEEPLFKTNTGKEDMNEKPLGVRAESISELVSQQVSRTSSLLRQLAGG
jgi:hypothetical protein